MRRTSAGIFAIALLAAMAQGTSAAEPDRHADWLKQPTRENLFAVWPREALIKGVAGEAVVGCVVTVQGALRDCQVRFETPPGLGFGAAALTLTSQFLMRPAIKDGVPVEETIGIPIKFQKVPADVAAAMTTTQRDPSIGSRLRDESPEARNAGRVVSGIVWDRAPSVTDVAAAYPARGRGEKRDGRVDLDCAIDRKGGLTRCATIVEEPKGYGFGRAAEGLAAKFAGPATDGKGVSLAGIHTQIPVTFAAASLGETSPVIGKPHWTVLPADEDFTAAYPEPARKAGVLKARVVLDCTVAPGGLLTDCKITSEDPPGYGFGAGATALSGKFRASIWTAEGLPIIGGRLSIPIRYDLQDAPPPAAPPKP